MPSAMPARAQVRSSAAASAACSVVTRSGQAQALYFIRGPSTIRKKSAGTS